MCADNEPGLSSCRFVNNVIGPAAWRLVSDYSGMLGLHSEHFVEEHTGFMVSLAPVEPSQTFEQVDRLQRAL
jgi:hypothetical protein